MCGVSAGFALTYPRRLAYAQPMKRTAAIASALLILALAGCGSPEPKPTPSTEAEVRACMEEQGYPIDKPAAETEGFTMEGLREAGELCNLDLIYPQD